MMEHGGAAEVEGVREGGKRGGPNGECEMGREEEGGDFFRREMWGKGGVYWGLFEGRRAGLRWGVCTARGRATRWENSEPFVVRVIM